MGKALNTAQEGEEIHPPADNDNSIPTSRKEALLIQAPKYFDGTICVRGHKSLRNTKSGACVECIKILNIERREKFPAEARERKAKWRAENPGEHARRARDYRRRSPDKVRATEKAYRINNPERNRMKGIRHRARRFGAEGKYTLDDLAKILERQKYKCVYCGVSIRKKKSRHIDHIVPLSKGGSNWPSNLQILCIDCNLSKGDRLQNEFMRSRGFLI